MSVASSESLKTLLSMFRAWTLGKYESTFSTIPASPAEGNVVMKALPPGPPPSPSSPAPAPGLAEAMSRKVLMPRGSSFLGRPLGSALASATRAKGRPADLLTMSLPVWCGLNACLRSLESHA